MIEFRLRPKAEARTRVDLERTCPEIAPSLHRLAYIGGQVHARADMVARNFPCSWPLVVIRSTDCIIWNTDSAVWLIDF